MISFLTVFIIKLLPGSSLKDLDAAILEAEGPYCTSTQHEKMLESSRYHENILRQMKFDSLCRNSTCGEHSTCFLGSCPCHPGYGGKKCDQKLTVANMWYTKNCPNLSFRNTLDITLPLESVGGTVSVINEIHVDNLF